MAHPPTSDYNSKYPVTPRVMPSFLSSMECPLERQWSHAVASIVDLRPLVRRTIEHEIFDRMTREETER